TFEHNTPRTGLRALPGSRSALLECFRRGTEPQTNTEMAAAPQPVSRPPVQPQEQVTEGSSETVATVASAAVEAVAEGF
ncbi:MAG: hypothetical protein AB7G75_37075, partial [Candidatus Binatia bacterium]